MYKSVLISLCLPVGCQIGLTAKTTDSGTTLPQPENWVDSVQEPVDSGLVAVDTSEPPPVEYALDCGRIPMANESWALCFEGEDHCEVVYDDGAGCDAVCAAADLVCTGAFENRDGVCAPDQDRPALPCDSGHQSDYCICGGVGEASVDDPGPTPPEDSPVEGRAESLLAEREGFGRHATGGDATQIYRVTSLADDGPGTLRTALESPTPWTIIFEVDGHIYWETDVRVQSNKTVDGRGRDLTVDGTWRLKHVRNVIISDLSLTRSPRDGEDVCEQDGDVVLITGDGGAHPDDFSTRDIWLHHLDFRDGGDGLLDIRGGTNITVSWSHFVQHKKVSLVWQDVNGRPTEGMQVTWHHNHFDHTTVRNPRFHYGQSHFVNNYVDEWWQSGAASYDGAQFFSEANVYRAGDDCYGIPGVMPCIDDNPCAINNDWFVDRSMAVVTTGSSAPGRVRGRGDLLLNGAQIEITNPSEVFEPTESYSFPVEVATEDLAARIAAESGPRTDWSE